MDSDWLFLLVLGWLFQADFNIEAYIKIIRGINEEEIVKNTFKYRDYLNTMYQYQKLITELKNS